ncbi:MucBP domain-containing protein, partial [Paenibacillus sp. CECT 9249]|uniref:MucBP domain-containing protein n=1 Tax=Paenibacillus sp. CECT 9249 TaxID=2845385 RepID=UPI001E4EF527
RYVDEDGQDLIDPTTHDGKTGQTIELTAEEVPGYTPTKSKDSYTFTAAEGQEYIFQYKANKQTVTVRYVDEEGRDLIDPTTHEGKTGQTIELIAEEVPGYTPTKSSDSYTFTAVEGQEYIFQYKANKQTVTVRYVDEEGRDLIDPTTHDGKTGQTIELTAEEVPGYTPTKSSDSYTFTAVEGQEYIFQYKANKQTVTVRYVDEEGQDLIDPTIHEGKTGQTIELTAEEVPGYTPTKSKDSYTFTIDENQVYTFHYTAKEQKVTVRYVDEEGRDLLDPTTHEGKTGQTIELTAEEVPGYTPTKSKDSYTFTAAEGQEYIFQYKANKQTVTVRYVDEEGRDLLDPTTHEGKTGQTIELTAEEVPGYTPTKSKDSYTFTAVEGQEYIFHYTKDTSDERSLTVTYVNAVTREHLSDPKDYSGKAGETITLEANDITVSGVVYKPHEYIVEYTFAAEPVHQEYVFEYTADDSGAVRYVTVNYVERETGAALKEPTFAEGRVGETIMLHAEPITVADAVYTPENFNYDYLVTIDEEQEYTFFYTKGEPTDIYQLTVNYLDRETGAVLAEPTYLQGREGETVTLKAQEINANGSVYKPEQASIEYTFTSEANQQVVFYYTKEVPNVERHVTVKYLELGTDRQLANPTTISGRVGETVTLTAASISGYTAVKARENYTFTEKESQEYIFYYNRNTSSPGGSTTIVTSNPTPAPAPEVPALPPLPAVPPKLDTENHYNYINGYPDGMVKPENRISREEVAAIFYRLMDDESRAQYLKTSNSFTDIENERWSNKHISTMENAGIVTGYPDGTFKPEQFITRAEFAAIASRFDKLDERTNDMFTDVAGHWAEKYIASAANKGWIKGYPDNTFRPNQYITRAEAMAFINSVLNRLVKKDDIHADAKTWPDNTPDKWYYEHVQEATNHHEYSRKENGFEIWEQVKPDRIYP